MELLKLNGVHLTYPPGSRAADAGASTTEVGAEDLEIESEEEVAVGRTARRDQAIHALRGVSLTVSAGDGVCVLGHAGSGRSTLLEVMAGTLRPDAGTVKVRGQATGLIAAGAGFFGDVTVQGNVVRNALLMGMSRRRAIELAPAIAEFAGLGDKLETRLADLTRLESKRLGIAVAAHSEPNVFLADEQVAAGPPEQRAPLLSRLESVRTAGRALVVVTNRPELVKRLCDRTIILERGEVKFEGNVPDGLRAFRQARDRGGRVAESDD